MYADDGRPFSCTAPGCGMRFINEDHLAVHLKKHEMFLSLNCAEGAQDARGGSVHGSNHNGNNNSAMFVDQTPTPTRFIRNCEEVGLFQDLQNVNPFEDHFRKAVEANKIANPMPSAEPLDVAADGDILHTPSVIVESMDTVSEPLSNNLVHGGTLDTPVPDAVAGDKLIHAEAERHAEPNSDTDEITMLASTTDERVGILSATESTNDLAKLTHSPSLSDVTVVPVSVPQSTSNFPQAAVLGVLPSDPGNVVQFVLRLSDGRDMPISVSSMPTAVTSTVAEPTPQPATPKPITTIAKQKLRKILISGQKATSNVTSKVAAVKKRQAVATGLTNFNDNEQSSSDPSSPSSKRSCGSGQENSEEKRSKFLERNRAAATRCRQKRKQWVQTLENKAEELNSVNQQLQNEVMSLRNEVAQLKSMLLAHKDCPVTQQQKSQLGKLNADVSTASVAFVVHGSTNVVRIETTKDAMASSALINFSNMIGVTNAVTSSTPSVPVIMRPP